MKIYTTKEIFSELYAGKKFRGVDWKATKYIHLVEDIIVDNEGAIYDLTNSIESEWVEWSVVSKTPTLSSKEAVNAVFEGKKVKGKTWGNEYIELVDGQISLNGKPFNIIKDNESEWVIVEESSIKSTQNNANEIAELKKMIQELSKQINKPTEPKKTNNDIKKGKTAISKDTSRTELLEEVYGVNRPEEIQALFKKELESATSTMAIEKIVCEYIPYPWIVRSTIGSVGAGYSDMRRVIKSIENEAYRDIALSLYLPPQSVYEVAQDKIIKNKKEEIRHKKTFNLNAITQKISLIKQRIVNDDIPVKARQTKEREKAYHAYAYLTMVTARRQTEILKTLKIQKIDDAWHYCGVLKDREENKCIKAYSLDEDFEFLNDLLKYLQNFITEEINEKIESKIRLEKPKNEENRRLELQNLYFSEREINSKFNGTFSSALKRITGEPFKASDWRDISAEIISLREAKETDSHIDKRDLKAKILGHKYDAKLSATEHYDGWEAV